MITIKKCASVALLTLASQIVTAGPYSGLYVFGDSLYDSGNFGLDRRATNNVGPDYQNLNGVSGPIGIQFVADYLDMDLVPSAFGGTNYAVGGNQTPDVLQSITADTTYQLVDVRMPRINFNSYFSDLRLNNKAIDANALYVVEGGGNDIGAFDFANTAANLLASTKALVDNGAGYVILVDVPNFAFSPTAAVFPESIQALITDTIEGINNDIRSGVAAIDGNVILLDTYGFATELFDDPSAFGFSRNRSELQTDCFDSSSSDACQTGTTGGNRDSANPDPDQFFFNDSLHPTTFGQHITSDYIKSVLSAGSELALLPSLAMDSVQSQWQAARPTMRDHRWGSNLSDGESKSTVYGTVQQRENDQDTLISSLKGENEARSYHVGINYHVSNNAYFGVLLGRSDNELNAGRSQYEMSSTDISLLGAYNNGEYFIDAIYTHSDNDYNNLERRFSLGSVLQRTETADTDGDASSLAIQAGYDLFKGQGNYRLGPIVGYEYIEATVDGYQEDDSRSTSLVVGRQDVSSSVLLVGLFGNMGLNVCDCQVYAEVVYRNENNDGRNDVELGLVTVADNRFTLPGQSADDNSVTVDLGFSGSLTEALSFNVSAGASDADDSDGLWYGATLSYDL